MQSSCACSSCIPMKLVYIVIFVAAVWLSACWLCYWSYREDPTVVSRTVSAATPSSTPSTSEESTVVAPRDGRLNPGVLLLLPVFVFSAIASGEKLECAVCLTEFKDGDKCRTLPGCGHSFHKDCIDVWFSTHSTCPVCRAAVDPDGRDRGGTYGSEFNV